MLTRLLIALALIVAAPLALAQAAETYEAGKHFFPIDPPQPTSSGSKVEVIEVFSYGCIHCANFQPLVDQWLKTKPAQASFGYLPALFNQAFALFGRAYYTAEVLGVAEKSHEAMFKAVFVEHKQFHSIEDFAQFYAAYGVKPDDFVKAATSFAVETKLMRANTLVQKYGVDGTPNVIVAGKYRVTGESAGGYPKLFGVVNFLVAKEAATAAKTAGKP